MNDATGQTEAKGDAKNETRRPSDLLTFLGGRAQSFRSMDFLKLVPIPAGHQDSGLV
jgi:hypothetical protein